MSLARIGAGGPFLQTQVGTTSSEDDASLSIYIEDAEHDLDVWHGGTIGFRIDLPPGIGAQQFIEEVEDVVDLFDYEQVVQNVESDATLVLLDEAVEEPDQFDYEFLPLDIEQIPYEIAQQLVEQATHDEDERVEEFLHSGVDAPLAAEEIEQQFVEEFFEEEEDRGHEWCVLNPVPEQLPPTGGARLRYDIRTGLWVMILNDKLVISL